MSDQQASVAGGEAVPVDRAARRREAVGAMRSAGSLRVRARRERDVREIVGWVPDPAALRLFSGSRLAWPLSASQLQSMADIPGMAPSVVVTSSGRLVGHFDLTLDGPVARLGRVIVNPALRGRGLAIVVVRLALAEAERLGADVVRLNVVSTNEPALRAYRRAGFTTGERMPGRADVTTMEHRLPGRSP